MEHRNGHRKPSDLIVTLLRGGLPLGTFSVHNISTGGLAVCARIPLLPACCVLRVCVSGEGVDPAEPIEARAMVVHQNAELLGLMWMEHDPLAGIAVHQPVVPSLRRLRW